MISPPSLHTLHIHTSHTQSSSPINDTPTDPLKDQNSDHIRVLGTVLHPQVHYESLPITPSTTAREVIVALVDKYAAFTDDKSPDTFYLTEVRGVRPGVPDGCVANWTVSHTS